MVVNQEVRLVKKSKNDRIVTVYAEDLGIENAKLGQCYEFVLPGLVKLQFAVNRKDGTTLSLHESLLPRYVQLPRVGVNKKFHVISVRELY